MKQICAKPRKKTSVSYLDHLVDLSSTHFCEPPQREFFPKIIC